MENKKREYDEELILELANYNQEEDKKKAFTFSEKKIEEVKNNIVEKVQNYQLNINYIEELVRTEIEDCSTGNVMGLAAYVIATVSFFIAFIGYLEESLYKIVIFFGGDTKLLDGVPVIYCVFAVCIIVYLMRDISKKEKKYKSIRNASRLVSIALKELEADDKLREINASINATHQELKSIESYADSLKKQIEGYESTIRNIQGVVMRK